MQQFTWQTKLKMQSGKKIASVFKGGQFVNGPFQEETHQGAAVISAASLPEKEEGKLLGGE